MVLNFKEIPRANGSGGDQDTFELFAREYLEIIGLELESGPNRGPDGGKDMLFIETQQGMFSSSKIRWLVSCKHFAHSGDSVSPRDEDNIIDRMGQFNAEGFLGFYSTIISSGLSDRLDSFKDRYKIKILDGTSLERELLKKENWELIKRFFPVSSEKWMNKNQSPTILFDKYEPLNCQVCGKDLLATEEGQKHPSGIIAFTSPIEQIESDQTRDIIHHVYAACKGKCDHYLEQVYLKQGLLTGWVDIEDLSIPQEYLRWVMAILNNLKDGDQYLNNSFSDLKQMIIKLGQNVLRVSTKQEIDRFKQLSRFPIF